ncbi:MAG: hypothetical protein ACR2NZ_02520, partial [Rubripirellula sp.]
RVANPPHLTRFCNVGFFDDAKQASEKGPMRTIVPILTTLLSLGITCSVFAESASSSPVDDRDVYIVTSMIDGKVPKIGPARHASIAICPKGVSPIIYENGVPVSNWRECKLYGTQVWKRGFVRDGKRINARATKVCGVSAATVERRMRAHRQLNVPLVHDCRHHVIQVLRLQGCLGKLKPACTVR